MSDDVPAYQTSGDGRCGRCGRGVIGSGAVAAVDDLAAGEPGGDEGVSGWSAAELDGEVVHLIEEFGDFAGFGEKSGGEGAALADGIDGGGDEFLVIVGFLGELGDGGGGDAVTCGGSGGGAGGEVAGIGGEEAGLVEQDFVAEATPAADLEVVFPGGGEVVGVVAIVDEGAAELVGFVFKFFFFAAFVLGVAVDGGGLSAREFEETGNLGAG